MSPQSHRSHELRMHLGKFVCSNMPGFLSTFRSRNLLFCLEVSLSPPKARHMRAVLPCIDAALNQTSNVQAVFFKWSAHDSFPLTLHYSNILLRACAVDTIRNFLLGHLCRARKHDRTNRINIYHHGGPRFRSYSGEKNGWITATIRGISIYLPISTCTYTV